MANESSLTQTLLTMLRKSLPLAVIFKHSDKTVGVPDFSVTYRGRTTWWEVKYWKGRKFASTDLQELRLKQLAAAGYARYIVYYEDKDGRGKSTEILHPKTLYELAEIATTGRNHQWVCEQIEKVHDAVL